MKTVNDYVAVYPVDLHAISQKNEQVTSRFVNLGVINKLVELKVAYPTADNKLKAGQSIWVSSSVVINNKTIYTLNGQELWLLESKYIIFVGD